jgi:pyruvate formate lyase activating enzyme
MTYSIATPGCNLRCQWCQNWGLARIGPELSLRTTEPASAEELVSSALRAGCRMIAYTFTEPTVFFEYAYDTARVAAENGLANVCVTNGFMTPEMIGTFAPYLDGVNVDLKSFRDETHHTYARGRLAPVLQSLKTFKRLGIWLEVTTLVVPGVNDGPGELRAAAQFIAGELGVETPWHLSRFVPASSMLHISPTPDETLHRARDIGLRQGLRSVYLGNTTHGTGQQTDCPNCRDVLIRRRDHGVLDNNIVGGRCPNCGTQIAGIHMGER